jgi:hypothetical protein
MKIPRSKLINLTTGQTWSELVKHWFSVRGLAQFDHLSNWGQRVQTSI